MPGPPTVAEQTRPEQSAPDPRRAGFVLGLDVGSSVIRCHVYDRAARIRGSSAQKVESLYPQAGWVEIDPDILWLQFVAVIKESVKAAGLEMNQIVGLGISTQRATFITWDKKTGKHFHNFISWQDLRAIELVKSWNSSLLMKLIHSSCRVLHFFTRSKRFLAASLFTFTTQHVSLRLAWILQNLTEGSLTTGTGRRSVRNGIAQQEVSGGQASEASSAAPHRSHDRLNHPPQPPSMEKLSSMKPVSGAKKVGDPLL